MSVKGNKAWLHFKRNHLAMSGAVVFALLCLIALFAVPLASDPSPDAARQVTEAARVPPGTQKTFLRAYRRGQHPPTFCSNSFPDTHSHSTITYCNLLIVSMFKMIHCIFFQKAEAGEAFFYL